MSKTAMEHPARFHGLVELAKRQGWRKLEDTRKGGSYLSERTVFRDTVTGCLIWRMTCDPAVDKNDYYDIPGWNADGSLIGFLTRRTGDTTRWLMDANGANLRPMPTSDGRHISAGYWSIIYPDRFYHAIKDDRGTHVVAMNPFTGERQNVVSVNGDLGSMMPPHPSEEWFLFGDRKGSEQTGPESTIYVVGLDGSIQEVGLEKRWHRLRFTKSPDRRIFFNFDDPRTQWTILPDGTDRTSIPDPGSHPDWMPDGSELTYYSGGSIWAVSYDGVSKRRIMELKSGGHGGPCLDGEWFVSDTPHSGKYPGSILYLRTDGSEICHTIFRHTNSMYSHRGTAWHPDHHSSHPHPNSSPDGTKSIFNVELLGQYTNIYVGINRFPDPPQSLKARKEGNAVILTWDKPRRCRETRGYLIYRADKSGLNYRRLTFEPLEGTEWRGTVEQNPGYYVVTALEHSDLESGPSNEAFEDGENIGKIMLTDGILSLDTTSPDTPADLRAAPVSHNAIGLSWSKPDASDVDHFNVYCGERPDFACEQASLIGSPSETEFVDWGLALNTTYWYKVTAVDRSGNESPPTSAVKMAPMPLRPTRIALKPANASLENMEFVEAEAPGGLILQPIIQDKSIAEWDFDIPRDGEYAIWGRSTHKDGEPVIFDLIIDEQMKIAWHVFGPWDRWLWSPAGNMVTGSPQTFSMKAGKHTLRVKPKTHTSRVAEIVITDDPSWWPVVGMVKRK